jgi:outer membrane protein assembly factor BamB
MWKIDDSTMPQAAKEVAFGGDNEVFGAIGHDSDSSKCRDKAVAADVPSGSIKWSTCDQTVDVAAGAAFHSGATISPDGKQVAIGAADGIIRVFDTGSGKEVWRADTGGDVWTTPLYSEDGSVLFTGSDSGHVFAFHTSQGRQGQPHWAMRWPTRRA